MFDAFGRGGNASLVVDKAAIAHTLSHKLTNQAIETPNYDGSNRYPNCIGTIRCAISC